MPFIFLKLDSHSFVTLSTCRCLLFFLVIWYGYSCCWGSTFLSLLSLYFPFSYWVFLGVCFYFCCLFHYQQVRYPCSSPFGWEWWFFSSVGVSHSFSPSVCSPSFFTLLFAADVPFFTSRIVLLWLLGTWAGIGDWSLVYLVSFSSLWDLMMVFVGAKNLDAIWGLQLILFAQSSVVTVSFLISSLFDHFHECSSFKVMFL